MLRMDLKEAMTTNVRRVRHAKGLTQEDLANRAGLSVRYLGSIAREQLRRCTSPWLLLEINVGELLPISVANDNAGVVEFFNRPGRRKVALGLGHHRPLRISRSATTITKAPGITKGNANPKNCKISTIGRKDSAIAAGSPAGAAFAPPPRTTKRQQRLGGDRGFLN
jgi:transcriptional regulator with XRE-family HTH domain